jgi:hypothetical protein
MNTLREALKNAKGAGNFRNIFLHAPGGKKDGIQLILVSEVAAKEEFFNVKNITRNGCSRPMGRRRNCLASGRAIRADLARPTLQRRCLAGTRSRRFRRSSRRSMSGPAMKL